jgi:hypothetical protein
MEGVLSNGDVDRPLYADNWQKTHGTAGDDAESFIARSSGYITSLRFRRKAGTSRSSTW